MPPGSLSRGLVAATLVAAGLTSLSPAQATGVTDHSAELSVRAQPTDTFDLATYLAASPTFAGTQIDLSGVEGTVVSYQIISSNYTKSDALGYKETEVTNNTDRDQTFTTPKMAVESLNETTYTVGHTFTVGATFSYKVTQGIPGNGIEYSFSMTVGYAAKLENAYKVSTKSLVELPAQDIVVGPGQTTVVSEWYERGQYDETGSLVLRLSGNIAFTACGVTVRAPIGAVLARPQDWGLGPLPSWARTDGNDVILTTDLAYHATPAVKLYGKAVLKDGSSEPREWSSPNPSSASSPATPRSAAPTVAGAGTSAPFAGPPRCLPKTSDGSAILLPDGRVLDPEWGTEIVGPRGVVFSAVSGARWHGVGTFLSAIDTAGNAYWFSRGGTFSKISLPTSAVQTADGVAILGRDGNVYDAGTGRRITSPSGVRFVAVSGVHHNGDAFYYSAIGTDGKAYWSDRGGAFRRLSLPASPVRTIDGAVLVTADGRLFTADEGREIAIPQGLRPTSISGSVLWDDHDAHVSEIGLLSGPYNPVVTVVDDRGNIFASVDGSPLAWRRGAGSTTSDGGVGLTRDGQVFTTFHEWAPSPATPPGVTFVAVSAGPDSLLMPTISAIASDGRIFWLSRGGTFREVDY